MSRTGKSYEFQVMRHLVQQRQAVAFELDARVADTTAQYKRKIDVWLPVTREIVECKHYSERPVGIEIVDRLVGTTQDVNAALGHIFSSSGFTKDARMRATKVGINCEELKFANKFEDPLPPTGAGYYQGDYVELCYCSAPSGAGDLWGRISYVGANDESWYLAAAISIDWGDVKAVRFVAYLILAHMLSCPPSDSAIEEFVYSYGSRFEAGQEWVIGEHEVGYIAAAETR